MYGPIGVEIIKEIADGNLTKNAAAEMKDLRHILGQWLGLSQPEPEPEPADKRHEIPVRGSKLANGTMQRR